MINLQSHHAGASFLKRLHKRIPQGEIRPQSARAMDSNHKFKGFDGKLASNIRRIAGRGKRRPGGLNYVTFLHRYTTEMG
jgi:hypothetical protein